MPRAKPNLVHSVAFRVSEEEWIALQRYAENEGATIPQVAKAALFERVGLATRRDDRRRYGQMR
jgi:hypothetical protein